MATGDDATGDRENRGPEDSFKRASLWRGADLIHAGGSRVLPFTEDGEHHVLVIDGAGVLRLGDTDAVLEPGVVLHWVGDRALDLTVPEGVLTFLHQALPSSDTPAGEKPVGRNEAVPSAGPPMEGPLRTYEPVVSEALRMASVPKPEPAVDATRREASSPRPPSPGSGPLRWRVPDPDGFHREGTGVGAQGASGTL